VRVRPRWSSSAAADRRTRLERVVTRSLQRGVEVRAAARNAGRAVAEWTADGHALVLELREASREQDGEQGRDFLSSSCLS